MRRLGPPTLALAVCAALLSPALAGAQPPPRPAAAAWLVFAPGHGGLIAAHGIDARRPVASLTKLMTAHLVLGSGGLARVAVVGPDAASVGESTVGLRAGEHQTLGALLAALVIHSANDAAVALADRVAGSQADFVRHMNREARRLGLRGTGYRTPYGLDTPGQVSTARDVLALSLLDMRDPRFRALVALRAAQIPGHAFTTRNTLLGRYAGLDGVKTGHTDLAGWNLSASAVRDGLRLYAVVLGSPNEARRDADVARLLDWGFDDFRPLTLVRRGQAFASVPVPYGGGSVAALATASYEPLAGPRDRYSLRVVHLDHAPRPLARGAPLGEVQVVDRGRVVARVPLVAARALSRAGLLTRARWLVGHALGDLTSVL
jgi:D-alanyl-D-alanine carboxypeptidase (penicillin-binding protein 5/6)